MIKRFVIVVIATVMAFSAFGIGAAHAASWTLLSSARWDAGVLDCRTGSNYIYGWALQSAGTYQMRIRAEWLSGDSSRDTRTYTTPRVVSKGQRVYFTLYGDQGGAKYPRGGCKVTQVAVLS